MRKPWGPLATALVLGFSVGACGSCGPRADVEEREANRVWGRAKENAALTQRAQEPIDARSIGDRPEAQSRVLRMPLEEVVARVGYVRYRGKAELTLERNGARVEVFEDSLIEFGLDGAWRVVQRDARGALLREEMFSEGRYYVRNGPGKLRRREVADRPGHWARREAFEPLATYTAWFGSRLQLRAAGSGLVGGRAVVEFRFGLGPGPELIPDPENPDKRLRPKRLTGLLKVDMDTGAPLAAKLEGTLEVEPPLGQEGWGQLALRLDFVAQPIAGQAIVAKDAIAPIVRREVDLDPLGFLKGENRKSTIIGGSKGASSERP